MTALLLLLLALPLPTAAQVIAPVRYAAEYCRLRTRGGDYLEAMQAATRRSVVYGSRPQTVNVLGLKVRLDVIAAQTAALERCPDL